MPEPPPWQPQGKPPKKKKKGGAAPGPRAARNRPTVCCPVPPIEFAPLSSKFFRSRHDVEHTEHWGFGWKATYRWAGSDQLEAAICDCDCCQYRQFIAGGYRLFSKGVKEPDNVYVGDLWKHSSPYSPPMPFPYPWSDTDNHFRTYDQRSDVVDARGRVHDLGGYIEDVRFVKARGGKNYFYNPLELWHPWYARSREPPTPEQVASTAKSPPARQVWARQAWRAFDVATLAGGVSRFARYGAPPWNPGNYLLPPRRRAGFGGWLECGFVWSDEPKVGIPNVLVEPYYKVDIDLSFLFIVRTDLSNRKCGAKIPGLPGAWTARLMVQATITRSGDNAAGFVITDQRWRVWDIFNPLKRGGFGVLGSHVGSPTGFWWAHPGAVQARLGRWHYEPWK